MKTLVFDTETTGLIKNRTTPAGRQPEIIEFYGTLVDLATGEVDQELDLLIKPERPITDEITRITGIDDSMVAEAPPFKEVADQIRAIISSADAVIAHNLSFDMDMVEHEFTRLDQTVPWPVERVCTVEQTVHLKGRRLRLIDLHELLFGEPFKEAHRAKNDTQALIRCAVELTKRGEL